MEKNIYSLSVIVPVYNAQLTLQRCLDSILHQSYENFELILVDDGSTDNSSVLCDTYEQRYSRVKVFHIKNSGIFLARKFGAERARGKILTFSDADDWLEENALETAMRIFCEYNPDMLIYTYSNDEGNVEKHLYKEGLYCGQKIKDEIVPGMMYDSTCGRRRLNPSLCCKLIRKELFTNVTESIVDRITLGEDALVTYPAICLAESIFICNKALYHYSVNNSSCTHTYPLERIIEVKSFQNNIIRLFNEIGILEKMRYQIENYVRSFFAMMVRNWYGMGISSILFSFPYNLVPKGSKLLIYGAGDVGKSYVNELIITKYADIVGWSDKNNNDIKEYHGISIIAPEQIKEDEFDLLLIAIFDETVMKEILADLADRKISMDKIIWAKPICII